MPNVKPLFDMQKEGAPTLRLVALDGHCPRCKAQLMWARKKHNMGIRTFYETCPKCLPESIRTKSPNEATLQIELLQRNLEALTSTALSSSRDIRRIQMELQFLAIDIEENESTSDLDTSNYQLLADTLATSLEDKIDLMIDSTRDEPPNLLEQVKGLHADLVDQLKQQGGGFKAESSSVYALVDVLKQLELVVNVANIEPSLPEEDREELRDEVDRLRIKLDNAKTVLEEIPAVSELAHGVDTLSDRYLRLIRVQEMDRKHSESDEGQELRKKMEEMERQHAAEVATLRSQLNTFMTTTVAANVVAVDSVSRVENSGNHSQEVDATSENMEGMAIDRHFSTRTVEAELVHPVSRNSDFCALQNLGRLDNVPETVTTSSNQNSQTTIAAANCSPSSNTKILEDLGRLGNVSEVLRIIEEHQTSGVIVATALDNLGNLQAEENRLQAANTGNNNLIRKATRRLSEEYKVHKENKAMLAGEEVIEAVLKGMKRFPEDALVQTNGLFAIFVLVYNKVQQKERVRTLGGITLILSAMRLFTEDIQVQKNGLAALGNLSSNDSKNSSMIGETGGIDVVLFAMHQFPNDITIQDRACKVISFLAKTPKMKTELRSKGAVDIVEKAKFVVKKTNSPTNASRDLQDDV